MSYEDLIGIRSAFLLGEKYRLDLSWDKAEYPRDGLCLLVGAKFSGPALSFAEKINDSDHIMLDFYKQYFIKVKDVYVAKLQWNGVTYNSNNGTVYLRECVLSHDTELNRVPKLCDGDVVIIDAKGHDRETHEYFLTYNAYVSNIDGQVYNFIEG